MVGLISNQELLTESTEMYLLRIAQLQRQRSPVPIPQLAQELAVSPVSVNEMCRKLRQRQLITYEPYKGVTLTPQGETLAQRTMGRRRLWEVFLAEKLGMSATEAEDLACRFEHVTSAELAERLARFLDITPDKNAIPLTKLTVGGRGIVAETEQSAEFVSLGLHAGDTVTVAAIAEDGVRLITVNTHNISLTAALAAKIFIITEESSRV